MDSHRVLHAGVGFPQSRRIADIGEDERNGALRSSCLVCSDPETWYTALHSPRHIFGFVEAVRLATRRGQTAVEARLLALEEVADVDDLIRRFCQLAMSDKGCTGVPRLTMTRMLLSEPYAMAQSRSICAASIGSLRCSHAMSTAAW